VSDEFRGRPGSFLGARFPEVGWDGIRRPQQIVLRAVQFFEDGLELGHDFVEKLTLADLETDL
jgi:hypothetical protein